MRYVSLSTKPFFTTRWTSAAASLALTLSLGACVAEDLEIVEEEPVLVDEQLEKAGTLNVGNWADQDTNGVGTHRITGDGVNIRADNLSQVNFVAAAGEQMVLSYASQSFNGYTYYEAYFKGGAHDGARGWVASDFLAHTQLSVCNGNGINVRTGSQLQNVIGTVDAGDQAFVISGTVRNTGAHRYFEVSAAGLQGFVATDFLCAGGGSDAQQILSRHNNSQLTLWDQTFGRFDGADPLSNIEDAAAGIPAQTSCYGTAPCNQVFLKDGLLNGMLSLSRDFGFDYFVTSIAGASHSATSLHYQGRAVDVGTVNGVFINGDSPTARAFMDACRALGAIEVLGPSNDPFHQDHIHCAW